MRLNRIATAAAAAFVITPLASAQWSDNFESYAAGSAMEGQGGWHNWDTTGGNQPWATVEGTVGAITPFQGTKMLSIQADNLGTFLADTVHELNGPYSFGNAYTMTTQVYVPSTFSGETYFIVMDDYADLGGPFDWAVQIHFQASSASVLSDAVSTGNIVHNSPTTILFDQWVELKVEIDLNANLGMNYYGGLLLNEYTWTALAGPEVLDAIDLYPGAALSTPIYFDSFNLVSGIAGQAIGSNYCTTAPNSTGNSGRIDAFGSTSIGANNVTLEATSLPLNATTFFITSLVQGQTNNPGGSMGNLCLGGAIGRYVGPGQIKNSGATGAASLMIDVTSIPQPNGSVSATAGQAWNFQGWHRDSVGGSATSNFTDGTSITFQP